MESRKKNTPVAPKGGRHGINPSGFSLCDSLEWNELNNGVIRIGGSIGEYEVEEATQRIDYLISGGHKKIQFKITSPGGSIYHAFSLYDKIVALDKEGIKVEALVEGYAASAASMIVLQAFPMRISTTNARFLLHEPRRFVFFAQERTSDIKDESREMNVLSDMIYDILAKRCGKEKEEIEKFVERKEVWLSAREAKEFGLIDKII